MYSMCCITPAPYLDHGCRGEGLAGLHRLERVALEGLDALEDPLDRLLHLDVLGGGQHRLLLGLHVLQIIGVEGGDACGRGQETYWGLFI